jgi:LPS O-antigen subunit length determinant protein (WzzB/FepE family)
MNNFENNKFNSEFDDEIDLYELISIAWNKKLTIIAITSIFAIISILYSLSLPNVYKSDALLAPKDSKNDMSSMVGQYAGLASLAGLSVPVSADNKSIEAITRIQSFDFFAKYFLPQIALENLMAVKQWDPATNVIKYDETSYNSDSGKWIREVSPPRKPQPSLQEAYIQYKKIMTISSDLSTSFVSLSTIHLSPFIAQKWNEIIINEINKSMREHDKQEATKSLVFLTNLTPQVNYGEIKNVLSSLQQEQMKKLMLIEANEDYIFKVIDSPISPENKFKPKRSSIVIVTTFLGFLISLISCIAQHYAILFYKNKQNIS